MSEKFKLEVSSRDETEFYTRLNEIFDSATSGDTLHVKHNDDISIVMQAAANLSLDLDIKPAPQSRHPVEKMMTNG